MQRPILPEDWRDCSLGDVSRIIRGASPRPKGDPRFYGGPVPRLMVEDVTRDGKTVFPSVDSLTLEGARRSRPCPAGTLTLVCSGVVGVPSFLGIDACIHDGFIGLIDIKAEFSKDFIYHQLKRLQSEFDSAATHGGVFTNLTTKGVAAFQFAAPVELAEQQAIAEALSDADGVVEGLERLIEKKRRIKQGAMQDLLTAKRRLPGFSGKWVETNLLDLADGTKKNFDDGDWIEAEHIAVSGPRLIQTGNIGVGTFLNKNKKFIHESSYEQLGCKRVQPGDVLVCRLAEPAGRACVVPDLGDENMLTSVDVTIFRPNPEKAVPSLIVEVLSQPVWFDRVEEASGGTTRKRIARSHLGKIKIKLPNITEQRELAKVFRDMDAEITTLKTRLQKARAIKEGMMQNLLTGRIRLV